MAPRFAASCWCGFCPLPSEGSKWYDDFPRVSILSLPPLSGNCFCVAVHKSVTTGWLLPSFYSNEPFLWFFLFSSYRTLITCKRQCTLILVPSLFAQPLRNTSAWSSSSNVCLVVGRPEFESRSSQTKIL